MAKNLKKIRGKVAFLCGNVHARKKYLQLEKSDRMYKKYPDGKVETCGSFLNRNAIVTINIHAINGGSFYNYTVQNYEKDDELLKEFSKRKLPILIRDGERVYDYIYLIKIFSYSN